MSISSFIDKIRGKMRRGKVPRVCVPFLFLIIFNFFVHINLRDKRSKVCIHVNYLFISSKL
jgi:hypothetical protein